jgi:hypothetical protein
MRYAVGIMLPQDDRQRAVPGWKPVFLAHLREMPVVTPAAEKAGVDRSTVYAARQVDPEFAAAWDSAMEAGIDRAEQEAIRRGVVGFEEPVIHQGAMAYRTERYLRPVVDATGNPVMLPSGEQATEEAWRTVLDANGQPVPLTVRKHSDAMLGRVLAARRAAYRTSNTEVSGPNGEPLQVKNLDDTARAARLAALAQLAAARKLVEDLC